MRSTIGTGKMLNNLLILILHDFVDDSIFSLDS